MTLCKLQCTAAIAARSEIPQNDRKKKKGKIQDKVGIFGAFFIFRSVVLEAVCMTGLFFLIAWEEDFTGKITVPGRWLHGHERQGRGGRV